MFLIEFRYKTTEGRVRFFSSIVVFFQSMRLLSHIVFRTRFKHTVLLGALECIVCDDITQPVFCTFKNS